MTVSTAWKRYRAEFAKLKNYAYASNLIDYDSLTVAPPASCERRGEVLTFLAEREYRCRTGKRMREAVELLLSHREELSPVQRREIELYHRETEYVESIPKAEYLDYVALINEAESVWHRAKREDDFPAFLPYLERIVAAKRRFALYYRPDADPYDTCLSLYEPGFTAKAADAFFAQLRERILPLIRSVGAAEAPRDDFLYRHYPIEGQRALSDRVMQLMGIDRARCTIGESEHPFTLELCRRDVRITTHYYEDNLPSSLYSVIHEGGHALYELGSGEEYEGTALAGGASMGLHESQSRLFENILGRGEAFVSLLYPVAREIFPTQLADVSEEEFFRAVNKAEPSLVRTEADELTYPLHVLVRFELERGLMSGAYQAAEMPALWREKMREYLGVEVPNDQLGVLQDSHWSGGDIGYFPSYALGSAYGAMFYAKMQEALDVDASIRTGDLSALVAYLTERIYRHAARYDPSELILQVCGEPFDPHYYLDYLEKKFRKVYRLA